MKMVFSDKSHICVPNDSKIPMKHQGSNVSHIYALPFPETQICIRFALGLDVSNMFVILHFPSTTLLNFNHFHIS